MKKIFTSFTYLSIAGLMLLNIGFAQRSEWVNQVIIVNSGKFESVPPFTDYVTVQTYDPVSQAVNVFGTIYTQSAQDIVILGNKAWVAAQDSIILYNIDTYQRIAAIADSGISRIYPFDGKLAVTKKFPIKRFFVEILDAQSLALLGLVQNISGDCGEAVFTRDSLYVAVNQGTLGTEGKIAVISKNDWILRREINLGPNAKGITNLFEYGGSIFSVNQTPVGSPGPGSITVYNPNTGAFSNKVYNLMFGEGYGLKNNLLYMNINFGIGAFNLDSQTIQDTVIIQDPGSLNNIFINSAAVDYLNSNLYINIGNRPPAFGIGIVANTGGDSLTSYPTGLNADAVAIDYRTPAGTGQGLQQHPAFSLYPNPATSFIVIKYFGDQQVDEMVISDFTGRRVLDYPGFNAKQMKLDVASLPGGIYFVTLRSGSGSFTQKFVKH